MNLVKKFSVFALMIATVVSMSGGLTVKAAGNYPAGSLLAKANTSGAAVYYIGADGMKYVFPDVKTYNTWYENFDSVQRVSVAELDMYPDGGAVTFRGGMDLVTNENSARVYAVEPGGVLRWIPTAETAAALYGANWGSKVKNVIPGFFSSSYTIGSDLGSTLPTGTIAMEQGGDTYYYISGTTKRPFASMDAFEANNFNLDYVVTANLSGYTAGTSITGEELALSGFMPAEDNGNGNQTGGDLTVSLSSNTTAQMNIPYNVQGFVYTTLKLTAGSTAVDVTGVSVKRTGLGSYTDFSKIYVEVDGMRHGTKRTLGSDNTVDINFATTANKITVPAGQTVYLDIVADMANANHSGNYNALQVTALETNGSTSGSLPITGNYMTETGIGVATASVSFDGSTANVTVGEEQVEVGVFTVDNTSASEDISFEAIILENAGSADNTEVINYTLYNEDDEAVSEAMNATGDDYIALTLDDAMILENGESHEFTVKADIEKGKTETIILGLNEATDFQATGLDNEYAVTATDSAGDDTYTIIGGDLTINESTNNPETQDVAPQTNNVVFLLADLESVDETSIVTALSVTCTSTGVDDPTCTDLEDVTVYLDDLVVGGPEDGAATIAFTDEFEVSGSQVLKVVADIGENASGTYAIALSNANVTVEDTDGDALTDSGSAQGNDVVVGTDAVTLTKDSTYGNQTMVSGDEDFLIGKFVLEASDYEGVDISNYKVHLTFGGGDIEIADIEELWISEDTDREDSLTATTTFSVNQELAAGETRVISVYATVDSSYTPAGGNDTIQVDRMSVTTRGLVSDESNTVYNSVAGQTITVDAGVLTLSNVSDESMDAKTVIGGNTYEVGKWNFDAANVGYTITEITVEAHNANTTNTSAVIAAELNGVAGSVVNGVMTFETDIDVAKDDDIDVTLEATFNDDFNTVTSGDSMEFAIVGYKYIADNDNGEEVSTGYSSTGELMHVRKSDVTVTTAVKDTTLTATTKMMDVTFTADAAGKVNVETATFFFNFHDDATVQGSSLTITNVQLKNSAGTIVASSTTDYNADTNAAGIAVTLATDLSEEISAGSSKTYTLVITVTNYATDDYINVKMMEDTAATPTYFGWDDDEATQISGLLVDGIESDVYEASR